MKELGKLQIEQYKPLRDIVFETLRKAILDGDLKPGERVMEVQLAEELGVSRTPVREAIRKLELEGLLIMVPRKGAYVADVSIKDVLSVLEIRASLEGLGASLAAERITGEEVERLKQSARDFEEMHKADDRDGMVEKDTEFHSILLSASRNKKLLEIVEGLSDYVQRFRVIYFTEYSDSKKIMEEHRKILEAIDERDIDKANKAAQDHIESIGEYLISHKSKEEGL